SLELLIRNQKSKCQTDENDRCSGACCEFRPTTGITSSSHEITTRIDRLITYLVTVDTRASRQPVHSRSDKRGEDGLGQSSVGRLGEGRLGRSPPTKTSAGKTQSQFDCAVVPEPTPLDALSG